MKIVYVLLDPRDHYTAYIGCSRNPHRRLTYHLSHKCPNPAMEQWFQELKQLGLRPLLREIQEVPDDIWPSVERFWIHDYVRRGFRVLNRQSYIPLDAGYKIGREFN